jgi:hypothetical protein
MAMNLKPSAGGLEAKVRAAVIIKKPPILP